MITSNVNYFLKCKCYLTKQQKLGTKKSLNNLQQNHTNKAVIPQKNAKLLQKAPTTYQNDTQATENQTVHHSRDVTLHSSGSCKQQSKTCRPHMAMKRTSNKNERTMESLG